MLNFKNKFESYSLSYKTDEFVNKLEDDIDQHPFLLTEGRKTWFKKKPEIINEIDRQLRKQFKIKDNNEMVFSLYLPPEQKDGKILKKETLISDQKENVLTRIIISTIDEYLQISAMGKESDKIKFSQWTAYQTPPLIGGILKYKFENSKYVTLPARKGFRSMRKTKPISKRYIFLFDYIVNDEDLNELSKTIDKFSTKSNHKMEDISKDDLESALRMLKN
jgi:hypothetical protein